jgi:mRNA interferase MazF
LAVSRGDIILVVAPGDFGKPRPGVVVQADELGDDTTTVLICPMSSEIAATPKLRPIIDPTAANGLRIRSQIMTDKVTALRRDRIRRVVGRLDAAVLDELDRALLIVLGLAR